MSEMRGIIALDARRKDLLKDQLFTSPCDKGWDIVL